MRKLTFAVGLVTGFVLGARAGRERYEQIAKLVRGVGARPAVVEARAKARSKAAGALSAGVGAVTAKIGRTPAGPNGPNGTDEPDEPDEPVIDGTA